MLSPFVLRGSAYLLAVLSFCPVAAVGQEVRVEDVSGTLRERALIGPLHHSAIGYANRSVTDAVSDLNRQIRDSEVLLEFDDAGGYLPSVLAALDVPVESQMLVFSKTSLQRRFIGPDNPRALFFNDRVAVGWIRGAPLLEVIAHDPRQGAIFYTLEQRATGLPQLERENSCLRCHHSRSALDVPGMLITSVFPGEAGLALFQFGRYTPNHESPLAERWGGWYVTGRGDGARHMGNAIVTGFDPPESMTTDQTGGAGSLFERFDPSGYRTPYSDIAALLVFNHQMHMMNLLTRVGWEIRFALAEERAPGGAGHELTDYLLVETARELVDYLLFVDELPLPGRVEGTSGFAEKFAAGGPADSRGRSLRQLDLERRLMAYPCSYMIYSDAFDGLPVPAREAIYRRLWQVLSGAEQDVKYSHLSIDARRAIVEILRETKPDLPDYFAPVVN